MLKAKPDLASIQDEFGDYLAQIFANNDSMIYCQSDCDVVEFIFELFFASLITFLMKGYSGLIPFIGAIIDWIDECHQLYSQDPKLNVSRVSEICTLTKST